MRFYYLRLVLLSFMVMASGCSTTRAPNTSASNQQLLKPEYRTPAAQNDVSVAKNEPKGIWHNTVWYVPNRVLDFIDIFRIRLRAGPGLAANVRVTDYANVFIGQYNSAFLGLPGPRMGPELRSLAGWEEERGILLMGVDATDDLEHEPGYAPTEFDIGLHVLVVGAELGFDPVELGDFLAGFLMYDLREDDR